MRSHITWMLALLIVGTACAGPAMAEKATRKKHRPETLALLHAQTFGDGGMFAGPVGTTMALNGSLYQVASKVAIYEIGKGPLPADTFIDDRLVFVNGIIKGSDRIVYSIMVRPEGEGLAVGNPANIRVVTPGWDLPR
jgi:hypothetical protein